MRFLLPGALLALLLALFVVVPAAAEPETKTEPAEPAAADDAEREMVRGFVEELREEAAAIRGLEWKQEIPADLLTREELLANMLKMVEEEYTPEERERDVRILRRLSMIGPEEDPVEMQLEAMKEMVGGYYDPDEKKLFLIAGMTGEAQKPVILHELVHALEDQYYDLKTRMEKFEDDPDRFFAEKCLGEGSAEFAREAYQARHPDIAKLYAAEQQNPEMMQKQIRVMQKIPAFLIVGTLLHYQLGPALVTRAVGDDFPAGINALYENPPVSQEQFLHPEKWFGERKDFPQEVVWDGDFAEVAGEGWEKLHDMTVGELDLAQYLDFFLGTTNGRVNLMLMMQGQHVVPRAKIAAAGWDGGRVYFMEKAAPSDLLENVGQPIAWIEAAVFDTVEDGTEAVDAWMDALRKANAGTFAMVGQDVNEAGERTFDYKTEHGPGRMLQRGAEVILVDGVTADAFEKVWATAVATRFEKDERDTWDPSLVVDVFADCAWSDKAQGIGINLPGDEWTAVAQSGMPGMVAGVSKDGVSIMVLLIPASPATAKPMIEMQMGGVAGKSARVAGADGWLYEVGDRMAYLGGAGSKTVVLIATGTGVATSGDEIASIAESIVLSND